MHRLFSYLYHVVFLYSDMTKELNKEAILPSIPLKRFGTPEEVAVSIVIVYCVALNICLLPRNSFDVFHSPLLFIIYNKFAEPFNAVLIFNWLFKSSN